MKKIVYMLSAAALVLASCARKEDTPSQEKVSEVKLSQEIIVAGHEGGSYEVTVTSSEPWRVAGFAEWVTVDKGEGASGSALKLTVKPNDSTEPLEAFFKVFAGNAVQALKVTSNPTFELTLLSEPEVSVSADANQINISLATNAEVELETSAGWLVPESNMDAFGKRIYKFNVNRSQEFKAREGVVTFSAPDVDPVEVKVTQAQRDTAFVVEGAKIVKGLEAFDQTLTIRTNVEDLSYTLPSWISETSASEIEMDEEGLRTRTIAVHADANSGSRASNVAFRSGSKAIGSVYLKQQTPNPIYAEIEDPALASVLENTGWILKDPENGQCEVLEAGLTGTSLTVNDGNVTVISGLDAFPALTTLSIGSSLRALVRVDTGNTKVTRIAFGNGHYFTGTELAIAGAGITDIVVACSSWQVYYGYDKLVTLDVSGCPALETLDARRQYGSAEGPLRTIYMTQAQSEKVTVQKNPSAQIVIK